MTGLALDNLTRAVALTRQHLAGMRGLHSVERAPGADVSDGSLRDCHEECLQQPRA